MSVPMGLGDRGRQMWDESLALWELTPAHLVLLGEACRIADRLEGLDRLIRESSPDLSAALPILAESRQQSMSLQRIFAELRQGARQLTNSQQGGSGVLSLAGKIAERRAKAQG